MRDSPPCRFVVSFLAFAWVGVASPVDGQLRLVMDPAPIEVCGGIGGGCQDVTMGGEIVFDPEVCCARNPVIYYDLWIGEPGKGVWPAPRLAGLEDLETTEISSERIELGLEDGIQFQFVELQFDLSDPMVVVVDGTYSEPCCDRFTYRFRHIDLRVVSELERRRLHLGRRAVSVSAEWRTADGSGRARFDRLNDGSGVAWFFSAQNPELLVKVLELELEAALPGAPTPFWFFAAGATNLGVTLTVQENVFRSRRQTYESPLDRTFESILDTVSFTGR